MADPDFGTDIDCDPLEGLSPTFELVSGRTAYVQSILRRLETPRGALDDAPADGLDLRAWLNREMDSVARFALEQGICTEARKDERTLSAKARVTEIPASPAGARRLQIALGLSTAQGPFRLTIGVDQLRVELLSLG
jgi:hypothetical protein